MKTTCGLGTALCLSRKFPYVFLGDIVIIPWKFPRRTNSRTIYLGCYVGDVFGYYECSLVLRKLSWILSSQSFVLRQSSQHPETILLCKTAMLDGVETPPPFPFGNSLGHSVMHSKVHVTVCKLLTFELNHMMYFCLCFFVCLFCLSPKSMLRIVILSYISEPNTAFLKYQSNRHTRYIKQLTTKSIVSSEPHFLKIVTVISVHSRLFVVSFLCS